MVALNEQFPVFSYFEEKLTQNSIVITKIKHFIQY
jgi:hypothetical protein